MLQLIVSRSKVFMSEGRHLLVSNSGKPQPVPDWVQETDTFAHGVKDGSIVAVRVVPAEPQAVTEDEKVVEEKAIEDKAGTDKKKKQDK
jgi:hypothetical protein